MPLPKLPERTRAEEAIAALAQVRADSSEQFFEMIAIQLAKCLGAEYTVIAELMEGEDLHFRTLGVCTNGVVADNFVCNLDHTYCREVLARGTCTLAISANQVFQNCFITLGQANVEAYAGTPLRDSYGRIIGIMEAHYTHAPTDARLASLILELFSMRVAAEIERKRAEQSLREIQAELGHVTPVLAMAELVASIGHEIKQPLTAVAMNSAFALRQLTMGMPNPEEVRAAIVEIVEDTNRINVIISKVRDLLNKGVSESVQLSINAVIEETAFFVRREASRSHVQLKLDLASDLPAVLGDRTQLQQVLINLAMNGIEAMRGLAGLRTLNIKSAKIEDGVLIRVEDTGIGLDPSQVDRIFEPFVTTKREGIGLGLSISRSIIEAHEGRLWCESKSGGAIFQFILPTEERRDLSSSS
jgi:signal transduction histidine kinase